MGNTIIDMMLNIREKMCDVDSGTMPLSNIDKAKADIDALAKRLSMTATQAVFLTAIVQLSMMTI